MAQEQTRTTVQLPRPKVFHALQRMTKRMTTLSSVAAYVGQNVCCPQNRPWQLCVHVSSKSVLIAVVFMLHLCQLLKSISFSFELSKQ